MNAGMVRGHNRPATREWQRAVAPAKHSITTTTTLESHLHKRGMEIGRIPHFKGYGDLKTLLDACGSRHARVDCVGLTCGNFTAACGLGGEEPWGQTASFFLLGVLH